MSTNGLHKMSSVQPNWQCARRGTESVSVLSKSSDCHFGGLVGCELVNHSVKHRFVLGLTTLFVCPRRVAKVAAILKQATLFRFHQALIDRKYRRLFSSTGARAKPGPKGPTQEIISAILEMKFRNPRFGDQRIAEQISHAFAVQIDKDVVRRVLAKRYGSNLPGASLEFDRSSLQWAIRIPRPRSMGNSPRTNRLRGNGNVKFLGHDPGSLQRTLDSYTIGAKRIPICSIPRSYTRARREVRAERPFCRS